MTQSFTPKTHKPDQGLSRTLQNFDASCIIGDKKPADQTPNRDLGQTLQALDVSSILHKNLR
jgi:hypothetical protein